MSRKSKTCQCCFQKFASSVVIGGKRRSLSKRKFCLSCSPFGTKDKRNPKDRLKDLDGQRTCSRCKIRKPLNYDNFPRSQSEKTGYRWECKLCASKRTMKRQHETKQKCVDYKGGKCIICGYNKCYRALHFHHLDLQQKDFTIGHYRSRAWKTIQEELDKCILVCANCHAELHDQCSSTQ